MHLYATPWIFGNAKQLRRNPTPEEELLWKYLRNKQFENAKFRRQHPMLRYVADFYLHETKMVIELDGKHHEDPDQLFYDMDRSEVLEVYGITILRFKNEAVVFSTNKVLEEIKYEVLRLRSLKKKKPKK
jgi:very-short-patch-repair endonuclease